MRQRARPDRGFILLMVLLIIPVIAVATASVARMSLVAATDAISAQNRLQRKWGQLSCTEVFLPRADQVLADEERYKGEVNDLFQPEAFASTAGLETETSNESMNNNQSLAVPTEHNRIVSKSIELGGQSFELKISDEQSKVNINLLREEVSELELLSALDQLQALTRDEVKIDLRPYARTDSDGSKSRSFAGLGQIYRATKPLLPVVPNTLEPEQPQMSDLTTCWGSGQLNIQHADHEIVRLVARIALKESEVDRLLVALSEDSEAEEPPEQSARDLVRALDSLGLTEKRRAQVENLLIDRSACYSLEVNVHDDKRSWRWLTVAEMSDTQEPKARGEKSPTSVSRDSAVGTSSKNKNSTSVARVYRYVW